MKHDILQRNLATSDICWRHIEILVKTHVTNEWMTYLLQGQGQALRRMLLPCHTQPLAKRQEIEQGGTFCSKSEGTVMNITDIQR